MGVLYSKLTLSLLSTYSKKVPWHAGGRYALGTQVLGCSLYYLLARFLLTSQHLDL